MRIRDCFRQRRQFFLVTLVLGLLVCSQAIAPGMTEAALRQAWTARYSYYWEDTPKGLAVDAQGNVYVTGSSESVLLKTQTDYATIKYGPDGKGLWVNRYNGPGNSYDDPAALALDGEGNVIVTGTSYGVSSNQDYATVKYNNSGEKLWVRRYNGLGNLQDQAKALAVDANGNVYVTGTSDSGSYNYDYVTIKYSPGGQRLWVRVYNGPGNGYDCPTAMAVDGEGNVLVTGYSNGGDSGFDYATVKYSPRGRELWVRRYKGMDEGYKDEDKAVAIAVDKLGNVIVTGTSEGYRGLYDYTALDYATVKYSPDGTQLWEARYNGPADKDDVPVGLAVDGNGNVLVTGTSFAGYDSTYDDFLTVKYDANGKRLWIRRYNSPTIYDDRAIALALDAQGNAYVTGRSEGLNYASTDYTTIKYSPSGRSLWLKRYNGGNMDIPVAIAVDNLANVYVTGYSFLKNVQDFLTVKYVQE